MQDEALYDPYDEESYHPLSPGLEKVTPILSDESDTHSAPPHSKAPSHLRKRLRRGSVDPGDYILLENLGAKDLRFGRRTFDTSPEAASEHSSEMTEQADSAEAPEKPKLDGHSAILSVSTTHDPRSVSAAVDANALREQASAVLVHPAISQAERIAHGLHVEPQQQVSQLTDAKRQPRSGRASPLKLQTKSEPPQQAVETIATSPRLRRHVLTTSESTVGTLPAFQPSPPTKGGAAHSPQSEKLPSFRQVAGQAGQLSELAELASQQNPQHSHHHNQSAARPTSPSLTYPYPPPYPNSVQASPPSHYNYTAGSPTSAMSDQPQYGSPTRGPASAYFANRRTSASTEHTMQHPPSLPSASSSGESHGGHTSSSTEGGYSTSHTTPIDAGPSSDSTPRPMANRLPPAAVPMIAIAIPSGYKCDYPGCTASLFQTQYLLSSHKNVHSSNRPHHCPVPECPRSVGGKGFKRKNEMISHGLVHSSPGYVCPFCPDKEHRYPRPDNLQRHVRGHHVDKDLNDPQLEAILAKRTESGASKTRRRRTSTVGSVTS